MHTCKNDDFDSWQSCRECNREAWVYGTNRDYDPILDAPGQFFDEILHPEKTEWQLNEEYIQDLKPYTEHIH